MSVSHNLQRLGFALTRPWIGERALRLNRLLGFLLAIFVTHGILRFFLLFRHDAYGQPLVGKADWYIFHALSLDYLWIFGYSLPLVVVGAWFRRLYMPLFSLLAAAHALLLWLTVLDHETLRFLGMHLDPSLLGTYGNSASIREVLRFVAADRSVPYLPYALFLGCVPLAFVTAWMLRKPAAWISAPRLSAKVVISFSLAGLVSWAYLNLIWTGSFRLLKLRPVVATLKLSLQRGEDRVLADDDFTRLGRRYQQAWLRAQGDSDWVFTDSLHPYVRTPRVPCVATGGSTSDVPGDGIDQDCDGVDAQPVNLVLLIFESHRAVNCGHLRPYGASASATPHLDAMAAQGRFYTRFSVGGIPTINALLATHMSVWQHPTRYIASDFTPLSHVGFPAVLGRHGYATHFFSAADPAWDNQTPWLRQWYQGIHYDRAREADAPMLQHMARYLRDSLDTGKPFFAAAMSKTNHYPFNPVEGVEASAAGASLQERMLKTMRYADSALGEFMDSLRNEPWFSRTLFIVMGDHGFPLGEHGASTIGYGLYTESTWIPLVIYGEHPRLPPPGPIADVAGQVDLAPTLLDLAGIRETNPFMGHSLLRPGREQGETWVLRGEQALRITRDHRVHLPWGETPREQGLEIFDAVGDPTERRNVLATNDAMMQASLQNVRDLARLHLAVIEGDRLWPRVKPNPGETQNQSPPVTTSH